MSVVALFFNGGGGKGLVMVKAKRER